MTLIRTITALTCLTASSLSIANTHLVVLTPAASGSINSYFPLERAFDGQPAWSNAVNIPITDPQTTGQNVPGYTDRYGYIDFGPNFRHLRITQTWTEYRPWSGGDHPGLAQMWWDDDKDTINDGITESQIQFNSAKALPHQGRALWAPDMQLSNEQAIIPKARYLIIQNPAVNKDRAQEFAFVGWFDEYAPPPPPIGVQTPLLSMPHEAGFDHSQLTLVDEVTFDTPTTSHAFAESTSGASQVQSLLGKQCRVLPNTADYGSYFAYQLAKGNKLSAGKAYVLVVDYPEDEPRAMTISNHGAEINRGFHTGITLGDALHPPYEKPTTESIHYGLSGKIRPWEQLFHLHDRFPALGEKPKSALPRSQKPEDGIWIAISQFAKKDAPVSKGAAVCRIALYEAPAIEQYTQALNLPDGLPHRQLFYREEMGDNVISSGNIANRGIDDAVLWHEYRARLMKFLGMNTYTQDLLEFGRNQGWNVAPYVDKDEQWFVVSQYPHLWEQTLARLMQKDYDLNVMPYYEYAGGNGKDGIGSKKRAEPLTRTDGKYTHVSWVEEANIDVSDPEALADAKRLLKATLIDQHGGNRPVPKAKGDSKVMSGTQRKGWGYLDLGENWADWRIQQGWTRSRQWHGGPATPYPQVYWHNSNTITDFDPQKLDTQQLETTVNFTTQHQAHHEYSWSRDFALAADKAVTPKGRFLVVKAPQDYTNIAEILMLGHRSATPNKLERLPLSGGQIDSWYDMGYLVDNQPEFNQSATMPVTGIWLRPRFSAIPNGFGTATLTRFAADLGISVPTKQQLQDNSALLDSYYQWWNGKRKQFLNALRDTIRTEINPNAVVLFTADVNECGVQHPTESARIVSDNLGSWNSVSAGTSQMDYDVAIDTKRHLNAQLLPYPNWGGYEFNHSVVRPDVANYTNNDGVLMTYTFNDMYTVSDTDSMAAFATKSGTAAIRHYCLNEDTMRDADGKDMLGYFVTDMELAGPYITLPEARAVANGDPHYLGYLASNTFNRGFPGYVRAFNANYLALPALPSQRRDDLSHTSDVVVRTIKTVDKGTWLAIINTGLSEIENAEISLPTNGNDVEIVEAVTRSVLAPVNGRLTMPLYPGQLKTVWIKP